MSGNGSTSVLSSPQHQSAVTNGKRMFVDGDGRGAWARRRRDLEALFADDMGGPETLSEFQRSLVAGAATLRIQLEVLEGMMSMGKEVDIDKYARGLGHYRRVVETLGVERRKRDVTPNLETYLEGKTA